LSKGSDDESEEGDGNGGEAGDDDDKSGWGFVPAWQRALEKKKRLKENEEKHKEREHYKELRLQKKKEKEMKQAAEEKKTIEGDKDSQKQKKRRREGDDNEPKPKRQRTEELQQPNEQQKKEKKEKKEKKVKKEKEEKEEKKEKKEKEKPSEPSTSNKKRKRDGDEVRCSYFAKLISTYSQFFHRANKSDPQRRPRARAPMSSALVLKMELPHSLPLLSPRSTQVSSMHILKYSDCLLFILFCRSRCSQGAQAFCGSPSAQGGREGNPTLFSSACSEIVLQSFFVAQREIFAGSYDPQR